jgi:hypothetical protein
MECTKKLNFFPPKGGVSEYYSPQMILHHENIDYAKHCAIPFGTYVQAAQENSPSNTQESLRSTASTCIISAISKVDMSFYILVQAM